MQLRDKDFSAEPVVLEIRDLVVGIGGKDRKSVV